MSTPNPDGETRLGLVTFLQRQARELRREQAAGKDDPEVLHRTGDEALLGALVAFHNLAEDDGNPEVAAAVRELLDAWTSLTKWYA